MNEMGTVFGDDGTNGAEGDAADAEADETGKDLERNDTQGGPGGGRGLALADVVVEEEAEEGKRGDGEGELNNGSGGYGGKGGGGALKEVPKVENGVFHRR